MEKISVDFLGIEITRKCNLMCIHCMRGDAENIDIEYAYIVRLFSMIESINRLFITGGEPSMNLSGLRIICEEVKKNHIKLNELNITSNGYGDNMDEYFMILKELQNLCIYPERSQISISVDQYHGNREERKYNISDSYKRYFKYKYQYPELNIIMNDNANHQVKALGRAAHNIPKAKSFPIANFPIIYYEGIYQQLYMNANGYLGVYQDCTYQEEDEQHNQLSFNISDIRTVKDLKNSIEEWNSRKDVKIRGTLIYLSNRINASCMPCKHYVDAYPKLVNMINDIIMSDDFQQLPIEEKTELLNYLKWYRHKRNVTRETVRGFNDICPWWIINPPVTGSFEPLKRIYNNVRNTICKTSVEKNKF